MVFIAVAGGLVLAALPEVGAAVAGIGEAGAVVGEAGAATGEAAGAAGEAAEVGGEVGEVGEAANGAAEGAEEAEMAEEGGEGAEAEANEAAEEEDGVDEAKDKEKGKDGQKDGKKGKKDKEKTKEEKEEEKKEKEEKKKKEAEKEQEKKAKELKKEANEAGEAAEKRAAELREAAQAALERGQTRAGQVEESVNSAMKGAQAEAENRRNAIVDDLKAQTLDKMDMADTFGTQDQMDKIEGKQLSVGETLETVSGGKALRGMIPTMKEWATHRHYRAIRGPDSATRCIDPECTEHEISTNTMADANVMVSFASIFGMSAALASGGSSSNSTFASISTPFGGGGGSGGSGSANDAAAGASEGGSSSGGFKAEVKYESRTHTLFKVVSRYTITLPEAAHMRFTPDAAVRLNYIWQCQERMSKFAAQKVGLAGVRAELGACTREFFRLYGSHIMRGPVRLGGLLAIHCEAWALQTMTSVELENSAASACRLEAASSETHTVTVQGSVGFLGFGGSAGHSESSESHKASSASAQTGSSSGTSAGVSTGKTSTRTEKKWYGGQPTDDIGKWTASLLEGDEYLKVFDRGGELVSFWEVARYSFDDIGKFKDVPLEEGEYEKIILHSTEDPIHGRRVLGPDAHKDLKEGWVMCDCSTKDSVRVNTKPEICGKLAEYLELEFFSLYGEDCYCRYCKGSFLPTQKKSHVKQCKANLMYKTNIDKRLKDGDYELRQDNPLDDQTLGYYLVKPVKCPFCQEDIPASLMDRHLKSGECTFDLHVDRLDDMPQEERKKYTDFKLHEVDGVDFMKGFYRTCCPCDLTYVSPPEGFAIVPTKEGGQEAMPLFVIFEDKIDDSIRKLFRRGYKRTSKGPELTLQYETFDRLWYFVEQRAHVELLKTLFDPDQKSSVRGCINNVREGDTLLSTACSLGDVAAANLLIEHGAQPYTSVVDTGVPTLPLVAAISRHRQDTVRLLLERRADPNFRLDGANLKFWKDWLHEGYRRSKETLAPLQVAIGKYSEHMSAQQYDELGAMHYEWVIKLLVCDYGAVALPAQWGLTEKRMLKFTPVVKMMIEQALMHRLAGFPRFLKSVIQYVDSQGTIDFKPSVLSKVASEVEGLVALTEGFAKESEAHRLIRRNVIHKSLEKLVALYSRLDTRNETGSAACRHFQRAAKSLQKAQAKVELNSVAVIYCESRPDVHLCRGDCQGRSDRHGKWSVKVDTPRKRLDCTFDEAELVPTGDREDIMSILFPKPRASAKKAGGDMAKPALPKPAAASCCQVGCVDGSFGLMRKGLMSMLTSLGPDVFQASCIGPMVGQLVGKCHELLTGSRVEVSRLRRIKDISGALGVITNDPCSTQLVKTHACKAVTRLMARGTASIDEASNCGAADILLRLLAENPGKELLVVYACEALHRVLDGSSSNDIKEAYEKPDGTLKGAPKLLLGVIQQAKGKVTQAFACMALKALLGKSPHASKACATLEVGQEGEEGADDGKPHRILGIVGGALAKGLSFHPLAQMAPVVIHAVLRQCQDDDEALAELFGGRAAAGADEALRGMRQSMQDYPNYALRAKTTGFTLVRLCTGLLRSMRPEGHFEAERALRVCETLAWLMKVHPQSATRAVGTGNAQLVPEVIELLSRVDLDDKLAAAASRCLYWLLVRCNESTVDPQSEGKETRGTRMRGALEGHLSRTDPEVLGDVCAALGQLFRVFPERAHDAFLDIEGDEEETVAAVAVDRIAQILKDLAGKCTPWTGSDDQKKAKGAMAEICGALARLPVVEHDARPANAKTVTSAKITAAELAGDVMKLLDSESRVGFLDCKPRLQQRALACLLHLTTPEHALPTVDEMRKAGITMSDEDIKRSQDVQLAMLQVYSNIRKGICDYKAEGREGATGQDVIREVVQRNPGNFGIEVLGEVLLEKLALVRGDDGVDKICERMAADRNSSDVQGLGCYQLYKAVSNDTLTAVLRKDDIDKQLKEARNLFSDQDGIVMYFVVRTEKAIGTYDGGEDTTLAQAIGGAAKRAEHNLEFDVEDFIVDIREKVGDLRRRFVLPTVDYFMHLWK